MATDAAMEDIDMDLDMDPEIARLYAEADAMEKRALEERAAWDAAPQEGEGMNGIEEAPEEGEVPSDDLALTKVHVRGVDSLNTFDLEAWAAEHFSLEFFQKVQWVDDTSANIVYDSESAAANALQAFSAEHIEDARQLRAAKSYSKKPDQHLYIRQAYTNDVKAPDAKSRSKYYLFNKEWDPDNPDNVRPDNRKRRYMNDGRADGKYRRRDHESRRDYGERRAPARKEQHFHESMYDDAPGPSDELQRDSYSSESDYGRRRVTFNGDLMVNSRETGRLRDRSASPVRDGDGRYGFDEVDQRRRTARARSRTPPGIRRGRDNKDTRDRIRQELFPGNKSSSSALTSDHNNGSSQDLFANRVTPNKNADDLFPEKVNVSAHRRQKAKSLTPGEVADAIGQYTLNNDHYNVTQLAYNVSGRQPANGSGAGGGRDLFSRISGVPKVESSFGRLREESPVEEGFSIKGAARNPPASGFNFLGASKAQELFPSKAGGAAGAGRDLFEGRLKGRAAPRQRAEDLF